MAIHPGAPTHLPAALAELLAGEVIAPHHRAYDAARRVWNGMIDKRPAAIARCADAADVAEAIGFATDHDLPLAVRGGGHNVASTAVVDDELVIDLSAMRAVHIDPRPRLSRAPAAHACRRSARKIVAQSLRCTYPSYLSNR